MVRGEGTLVKEKTAGVGGKVGGGKDQQRGLRRNTQRQKMRNRRISSRKTRKERGSGERKEGG